MVGSETLPNHTSRLHTDESRLYAKAGAEFAAPPASG